MNGKVNRTGGLVGTLKSRVGRGGADKMAEKVERFELTYEQPYITDVGDLGGDSEPEIARTTKKAGLETKEDSYISDDEIREIAKQFLSGGVDMGEQHYSRKGLALRRIVDIPLPT